MQYFILDLAGANRRNRCLENSKASLKLFPEIRRAYFLFYALVSVCVEFPEAIWTSAHINKRLTGHGWRGDARLHLYFGKYNISYRPHKCCKYNRSHIWSTV